MGAREYVDDEGKMSATRTGRARSAMEIEDEERMKGW
jgi:hypothetical protein